MAYTINLTNGNVFATINDGTINQIASGTPAVPLITLVGKNYAGYGEFLDENFVHLLESGSNSVAPTAPLTGQLWWDSSNTILKIYSGTGFKSITGSTSSASAPTTTVIAGDLWFDSSNQQLKVYTGAAWLVVGPGYTSAQGESGAIPQTILDSVGGTKYITSLYVNNTRVGVVYDGASFTPQSSLQAAFSTIFPGLTLSASVSGAVFAGTLQTDAQPNITSVGTLISLAVTGNITGGNVLGGANVNATTHTGTTVSVTGNITGGNVLGGANVNATTHTGTTVSVTGNITGGNVLGGANVNSTLFTGTTVSVSGNVTGGNLNAGTGNISTTGNVQAGNLKTGGLISATGNITTAATGNISTGNISITGVYSGDGSGLTNLGALAVGSIANGTSNIGISGSGGNGFITIGGTANVAVFTTTTAYFIGAANVTGIEKSGTNAIGNIGSSTNYFNNIFAATYNGATVSVTGNITGGNVLGGANVNATTHTGTTVSVSGNITGGNLSGTSIVGTLTTAAQTNITSVGTLGSLAVTGNITGGNVLGGANVNATTHTGTTVSVSGTITGGNLAVGSGTISTSGNITGGNVLGGANVNATTHTGSTVSVTGNITGGNLNAVGLSLSSNVVSALNVTGAIAGANVTTPGLISATGNITGGNVLGGANVNATTHTGATVSVTGNITGGNVTVSTGTVTLGNIVNANGNATGNIGSSSLYFNTVFALATSAQYADLAERYAADSVLEPGTVVDLGGSHEITQSQQDLSDAVFGVISTSAAYMMNSGAGDNNTHPLVAIAGRVPTKVIGTVQKGDRLVSAGNGVARAAKPGEATWLNVIGRALENKDSEELGMIEATVSVK